MSRKSRMIIAAGLTSALAVSVVPFAAFAATGNVRLTNDYPGGGYTSVWNLNHADQIPLDATLAECSRSRGRENEPSVAVDPSNTSVVVGSSNDYCGIYNDGLDTDGSPLPVGPVWLGYYRSMDGGQSFQSSLVPGYPGDNTPYALDAHIRTASSGDPVLAWSNDGYLYAGSESSDDPAGSAKSFGDVYVATFKNPEGHGAGRDTTKDGLAFARSEIVARGVSAPNLNGVFNDKTAIEVDRTGGPGDGNVYFAYSRFNGYGSNSIYFSRSTNHGKTWSHPLKVSAGDHSVQFPDIAVTGDGRVFVTWREFSRKDSGTARIDYARSRNYGGSFSHAHRLLTFTPSDAEDVSVLGGSARDCGDDYAACASGYTFFRRDTQVRSTADQTDKRHDYVYLVYDATVEGTRTAANTTYSDAGRGYVGWAGIHFVRLNGANGNYTSPRLIDRTGSGNQVFPDISADRGMLHTLWWDSRNDPAKDIHRPIGNDASGNTYPSLDVYSAASTTPTARRVKWLAPSKLTTEMSNPNYEQFAGRRVPFAGDYLWISSVGSYSYGVWTDWRNTVQGTDQRESDEAFVDANDPGSDVKQCRYLLEDGTWSGDTCPRAGGLDQDIYGSTTP